ncbi:hypothetical protein R1A27_13820 [Methylobacterium sp. NMS12]|uniref:hypothetical protein n=1 Tax=Methylobacterium sp. NMS12 TaxID=3079766 RepID=UPI003F88103D
MPAGRACVVDFHALDPSAQAFQRGPSQAHAGHVPETQNLSLEARPSGLFFCRAGRWGPGGRSRTPRARTGRPRERQDGHAAPHHRRHPGAARAAETGGSEARYGALSYVWSLGTRDLVRRPTGEGHEHGVSIASLHVHRNRDARLDVAVLRGPVARMQSYADAVVTQRGVRYGHLHLIPELVGAVEFHKGPYFVRDGDLRLHEPGRIDSLDSVPKNLALTTVGSFGDERGPSIASLPLGEGTLLVAGAARLYDWS